MLRTLIVEDYSFFREIFKTRLLEHFPSMIIDEAINGKEAMEKINQMPPHLIFMDICLPGSNGLQLTRTIKKYYPNLKIAMLTAFDIPEYRQAAEQDAERFFVKDSLDWKEVEEFVRSLPKNDRLRKGSIGGGMRNGQEDFYS
jgi:two-component system response regulator YesN